VAQALIGSPGSGPGSDWRGFEGGNERENIARG